MLPSGIKRERGRPLQAAEKEFREAVRLKSTAENHYSLAACLMTMDRNDEALAELEVASRLDPARTLYRARREELLIEMKNHRKKGHDGKPCPAAPRAQRN